MALKVISRGIQREIATLQEGIAMKARRGIIGAATAGALALGLTLAGAGAANAITRMGCANQVLNLISSSTTCWGNAGTANVALYGVYGVHSGDNAGNLTGSQGGTVFQKWQDFGIPSQTITVVRIW
jgi:hypothetical protein